MAAQLVIVGVGAAVATGAAVSEVTNPQTTGTTIELIAAIAAVLIAVIGVVGNYLSNRRTAPSPPGPDAHDLAVHDRVTILETNLADLRHRVNDIDARVSPVAAVLDASLTEIRRRLDRLEDGKR